MLDEIVRWLTRPLEPDEAVSALVSQLAEKLIAAGIPLHRISVSFRTMHPEVWARNVTWTPSEMDVRDRDHTEQSSSDYLGSTVQAIHRGTPMIRQRLDGAPESIPYPQLLGLKDKGATDYVIHGLPVGSTTPTYMSLATVRPGGFSETDLERIAALASPIALRVALLSAHLAIGSLLDTYLGPNAARRVMAGSVRRGVGEEIHAAILFCDMRGFTTISDTRPASEVVHLLDEYFDCVAPPVQDNGGEVLKFIGDAMLAVFPTDPEDPARACEQAINAAEAGLDALKKRGSGTAAGFAVHCGPVLYGNIGARTRLDFTVIGAAVNEASRVQGLCKDLDVPLLATDAAVAGLRRDDVVSLGKHALRGVREARGLFTLARFRKQT